MLKPLKFMLRILPVLAVALAFSAEPSHAQGVSAYFGLGSAWNSAGTNPGCPSQQIVDPFTGGCAPSHDMSGVFGVFGADFMVRPHLGFNGEYTFRFAQQDFLPAEGLRVRPNFYDFNVVYQPSSGDKRVVPVLEGGIGGAKLSFYLSQQTNIFSQSQYFVSSNHFQVHGAAGVKLYVRTNVFLKPQFDIRYVHNLTDQYGHNYVPEFTMSIGYTFGR